MRYLLLLLLVVACGSATPEPCTEAAIATHAAVCNARIRLECKPLPDGSADFNCPVFVKCNEESITEETRCNAR